MIHGAVFASAQTPAFPGALGFGANATGGRAGSVYHVTTLADSGAGSFRTAVSSPNRIVVFDVGGYINLLSAVSVRENITIAGQTAPGGGIGFKGGEVSFASRNNIICRFIRIRPGSDTASSTDDALSLYRAKNVILDHVSMEFAPWNNVGAVSDDWQNWPVTDVTFQNCLNANPTGQQFGAHTESVSSTMAWFYTIFANSHNRNPMSKINDVFVNNVLYNCSAGYTTHTSTSFDHDIVNNYFIAGPGSSGNLPWYQIDINQSIYYSGNYYDGDSNGTLGGGLTTPYWYQGEGTVLPAPWSSLTSTSVLYTARAAYRVAVSTAGTFPRDQVDDLVLSQVKTLGSGTTGTGAGTAGPGGGFYTSQTQTGLPNNGYGIINGGTLPADTDGDGMPDYFEQASGYNLGSPDAMTIGGDGYARIEKYINWLAAPHASTVTNTPVIVDLWPYTTGFTNDTPAYSVSAAVNGSVSLSNSHFAVFTPATSFIGLGSLQFTVNSADGSAFTNIVGIAISALSPPSNLLWQGDGVANVWTNAGPLNWLNGATPVSFNPGDNVTFDDSGAASPAINLATALSAGSIAFVAAQDYLIGGSGALVGNGSLYKVGQGTLTLTTINTFTGGTTINEGIVQLGDGVAANGGLAGSVTNNDTLIYATPGTLTSSVNITGSGTLTKNGPGALTLSGTQTYTNLTTISAGSLKFTGTPPSGDIANAGSLIFSPSGFVTRSNSISGPGAVTVSVSSGMLTLASANGYAGGTTNTAGSLFILNSDAIGTGPLVYTGGTVFVGNNAVVTNDFMLPSSTSDLSMAGTNNNTGTWAGKIITSGGASWRPGSAGGTLIFTGNALLGAQNFIVPRGTLQIASNAVISATGTATAFGRDGSAGNRSANVTIKDNAVVTLGVCNLGGGLAGGNSTLTIQNSAVLNCGANNFDVQNVNRTTANTFIRLNGGTLTVGGFTKTKTSQTNTISFNGGILKAGKDNAAFLPAFNVATNLVQAGGAKIDDGGFAITIPAALIHDPALGSTPDGGLVKFGVGTLIIGVSQGFTRQTYLGPTVINGGTLALALTTLTNSAGVYINSGSLLDVFLSGSATPIAQMLWGNGSVKGNLTIGSGTIVAPGSNTIGTLTFSNALTLAVGSTNFFEISHAPLTNDLASVFGSLTNGGTLIVTNSGGAPLAAGDSFKLFNAASYSGNFSSVQLPTLLAGLAWNTNGLNTNGTISVISTVPAAPPVFGAVNLSGNALTLSGSNGPANGSYYVLAATNLSVPRASWDVLATNPFDAGGNFTFTNSVDSAQPQKFYLLRLP